MPYSPVPSSRSTAVGPAAGWAVLVAGLVAVPLPAQLPRTTIDAVYPPGGKAGQTVEVTVTGPAAGRVERLVFSHPGIVATVKTAKPDEFAETAEPVFGRFDVAIAASVPPGVYQVRAVGMYGLSNPRAFVVGTRQEIVTAGTHRSPEKAVVVPVGATVNSRTAAVGHDYYRVKLQAGQKVALRLSAQQIDSRLSAVLSVFDSSARQLAQAFAVERDPVLLFTAPRDDEYLVRIHDEVFAGGNEYFYRLTIDGGPFLLTTLPVAGIAGQSSEIRLVGWNLPRGKPAPFTWRGIPLVSDVYSAALSDTGLGPFPPLVPQFPNLAVSSVPAIAIPLPNQARGHLAATQDPVVVESPNSDADHPQRLTLPCDVTGMFYPEGDDDWYEFVAQQGKQYWIEVISHRMGSDADPVFLLQQVQQDSNGRDVGKDLILVDDPPGRNASIRASYVLDSDDPALLWTAPADGTYRIMVRDQFGSGRQDPRAVYRLVIRSPRPSCRIVAIPQDLRSVTGNAVAARPLALRRGESAAVRLLIERREGFSDDVTVEASGVPKGVKAGRVTLTTASGSMVWLTLQAAADAPGFLGPIELRATSRRGKQSVQHPVQIGSVIRGTKNRQVDPARLRLTDSLWIHVREDDRVPLRLDLEQTDIATSLGGEVALKVHLAREAGFDEPVTLTALGLPKEITLAKVTAAKGQSEVSVTVAVKNARVQPGVYTFILRGDTKQKRSPDPRAVERAAARQQRLDGVVKRLTEEWNKAKAANPKDEVKIKQLAAKLQAAQKLKKAADNALNAAKKAAAPKDVSFSVTTLPVTLRVEPSP